MNDLSLFLRNIPEAMNAFALNMTTGTHGAESLTAKIPCSIGRAYEIHRNMKNIVVNVYGENRFLWRGRLEDVSIINEGVQITAYGLWRALSDNPYVALWSDTDTRKWTPTNEGLIAIRDPERYIFANDNRVRINLKKNASYGHLGNYGGMYYRAPDKNVRPIVQLQFDYAVRMPNNWGINANAYTAAYSWLGAIWPTLVGAGIGTTLTGSVSVTVPNGAILEFVVGNGTGSTYTNTAEDSVYFAQFTNVRVMSVSGSTVTPGQVIVDMLGRINSEYNEVGLNAATTLIADSGIDLPDEIYEDLYPSEIIDRFVALGDTAGSPLEAGIDNIGLLYFRKKYSQSRTWYVDTASLTLDRSMDGLRNSAYGVYKDSDGFTLRTDIATDFPSQIAYGITRRQPLAVDSSSASVASQYRDVFIGDNKRPDSRAGLVISRIYSDAGTPIPLYSVAAGDTLIVRNVQTATDIGRNGIDSFRITRTEYDAESDTLKVEPERPAPTLDALIYRTAARIGQVPNTNRQHINYLYKP